MEKLSKCKCGNNTTYGLLCVRCSNDLDGNLDISLDELKEYETCEEYIEED